MTPNNLHKQLITAGLHYLSLGFSIVLVTGKHPSFSWKEYQLRCPTQEEFVNWFIQYPDTTGIALVTGPISKVVVLDVELGEDITDLNLPPTASTATGGGGYHFFFKYPRTDISNSARVQGRKIDIRGKGGLIVLPPSLHPSGNYYKELIPLTQESLVELPESVSNLIKQDNSTCSNIDLQGAIPKGQRNDQLTRILGKMLKSFPAKEWESVVLPKFLETNMKQCEPPLEESEVHRIFDSITDKERQKQKAKNPPTGTTIMHYLMEMLAPTFDLVVDQHQEVFLFDKNILEPITSEKIKQRIKLAAYKDIQRALSDEQIKSFVDLLTAQTLNGPHTSFVSAIRVSGSVTETIIYDLVDNEGNVVVLAPQGYSLEKHTRPLFRRYKQQPQVAPILGGLVTDLDLIFEFVPNLSIEDQKLLKWYIVSLFIPGFEHPMLLLRGDQGAGKSMLCDLITSLVDPKGKDARSTFPSSDQEFALVLGKNWLVAFDNIDHLPRWASDLLCIAITGGSMDSRKLYTNSEIVSHYMQNPIMMNGISISNMKADLLDRSIMIDLDRMKDTDRMEKRVYHEFLEHHKPRILGAIFATISEAMKLFPNIALKAPTRMAEFSHVVVAIAIATGSTEEEAMHVLHENTKRQHDAVIEESLIAQCIITLIEQKTFFEGNSTELLKQLQEFAGEDSKELPKRSSGLSNKIKKLKTTLIDYGIAVEIGKDRHGIRGRFIRLKKGNPLDTIKSSSESSHDENVARVQAAMCIDLEMNTDARIDAEKATIDEDNKGCYDNVDKTTDSLASEDKDSSTLPTN